MTPSISPLQRIAGRTATSLASRATTSTAATINPAMVPQQQLSGLPKQETEQRRSFWMDVVTRKPARQGKNASQGGGDNNKSKFVHEDPEQVVRRHTDETRSDGEALLDLMFFNDRHEKAWKKRQRLKETKRYEFDKRHVNDLAKYIAFVKDHKE